MILMTIVLFCFDQFQAPEVISFATVDCATCTSGFYYDGCNDCSCNAKDIPSCTRRYCIVSGTAQCIDCTGCPDGYNDGCNDCTCDAEGRATCSTELNCLLQGTPYCNDAIEPTTTSIASFDGCTECTSTWNDGCNTCTCDDSGNVACTKIYCDASQYGDPYCIDSDITCADIGNICTTQMFNDGCNDCYCDADGAVHCDTNVCKWEGTPYCIDCNGCPDGYYDGCNTCTCSSTGEDTCTEHTCVRMSTPYCNDATEPVTTETGFDGCTDCASGEWFDGCNDCWCDKVTGYAGCTKMACSAYTEPYCIEEISCGTCESGVYSDGCNNCYCDAHGVVDCTDWVCFWEGVPYCIDCEACPDGYYDGCNTCTCTNTLAECTEIACTSDTQGFPDCTAEAVFDGCTECTGDWNDGCNECSCDRDTGRITCTLLDCVVMSDPYCLDDISTTDAGTTEDDGTEPTRDNDTATTKDDGTEPTGGDTETTKDNGTEPTRGDETETTNDDDTGLETTEECERRSCLGHNKPCRPDPGHTYGCGLNVDLLLSVCVVDRVDVGGLEDSLWRALKTIVYPNADALCDGDLMFIGNIEVWDDSTSERRLMDTTELETTQECPDVVDSCGAEDDDRSAYKVRVTLVVRCSDCTRLQEKAMAVYEAIDGGTLKPDFESNALANSKAHDTGCGVGLGRIIVDGTITITLYDETDGEMEIYEININSKAPQRVCFVGIVVGLVFLSFFN